MVQTDIAYDNNYNRKLVNLLREMDEKHWKKAGDSYAPTLMGERLGSFHGEQPKIGGGAPQQYVSPGNSSCYPPAHFHTGMVTRRKKSGGSIDWSGVGNSVLQGLASAAPAMLMGLGEPAAEEGGRLARAKSIGRRVKRGRKVMFEGLPDTSSAVAQVPHKRKGRMIKGSPEAMQWAEKMRKLRAQKKKGGSENIKSTLVEEVPSSPTGAGRKRKSKKEGGFSLPKLSDIMEVAKPVVKELGKAALDKGVSFLKDKISGAGLKKTSGGSGGRAKRAEIVKKVMKEKGLKMIEASKYVKQHGLY
jgi:hypothetical protein